MATGVYTRTQETKDKIRASLLGNKRSLGYKHSEETKKKMSDSSFYKGKCRPLESVKKSSETRVGQKRPTMSAWNLEHPNQNFLESRWDKKRISKYKDTKIEVKIEEELIKRGIQYQKQTPLCKIAIVDFFLPQENIIIQADGCYWHDCPEHGKGYSKKRDRDIVQDKALTLEGFKIYRFWEHEINKSTESCINKISLI